MNKIEKYILIGSAVVLALVTVFSLGTGKAVQNKYGAVIGYQSALGTLPTWQAFNSLLTDLNTVRAPLAGVITATPVSFNAGTVTPAVPTSTTVATPGAVLGDFVLVSMDSATSSATYLQVTGFVSGAGTSTVVLSSATGSIALATIGNIRVKVLPAASFVAPSALVTTTSTTTN